MENTIIPIIGMHCKSCEILIEDELKQIPGIKKIKVDHKTSRADIQSDKSIPFSQLESAVNKAGYKIGSHEKLSKFTNNKAIYRDLILNALIVLLFVLFFRNSGFLNPKIASQTGIISYPLVLIIGLTAGISTCMALVGGLVLGIASDFARKNPQSTSWKKFQPHLYFNLGRIGGFFILGGLIGEAGSIFQMSPLLTGALMIGSGLVMLLLGLKLTEVSPELSSVSLTLPKSLSRILGLNFSQPQNFTPSSSVLLGASTFFLPCGFTQAMQISAIASGNLISGSLIMGLFALGTAPGLLGIGGLTSFIKGAFAGRVFRLIGVIVIFMALFNIANGYNLTGARTLSLTAKKINAVSDIPLENGYQIIRMTQTASGYTPDSFTVKKGIPVKWIIDSKDPYTCAASIVSSRIGIRQNLKPGENILEFTPQSEGENRFSCSMGMYSGIINVIN